MGELILLLEIPLLCTNGVVYWPSNCAVDGGTSTGAGVAVVRQPDPCYSKIVY